MKRPRKPSTVGRRGSRNEIGERGEILAADFLVRQGYEIIARNWQGWWGEVDILARKGEVVVAVEVKVRSGSGTDLDILSTLSFSASKRQRIGLMLESSFPGHECRFDLVVVRGTEGECGYQWVRGI